MNKLIRYVPDADLRVGYDGLSKIVNLKGLNKGEFVAFVNRKLDKIKLATMGDMIAYHRLPKGQRIDPRVISILPEYFDGTKLDYNAAVEKTLRKTFPKWFESK